MTDGSPLQSTRPEPAMDGTGKVPLPVDDFRVLFDRCGAGIAQIDMRSLRYVRANAAFQRMIGYTERELAGLTVLDLTHPDDREDQARILAARRGPDDASYSNEKRYVRKDGSVLWVRVDAALIFGEDGRPLRSIAVITDITDSRAAEAALRDLNDELERRVDARTADLRDANRRLAAEVERREAAQAALVQSQKLEALGKLTSGIAHDFNNVIMAISGGFSVIARRSQDQRLIEVAEHGVRAAERGGKLVKKLLAFARQQDVVPETVNLGVLLDEARPLLERSAGPDVDVRIAMPGELPPARVDPSMLESALINLAVNARDAIDGRGTLDIAVSLLGAHDDGWPDGIAGDRALCIRVSDDGRGMPPDVLARVTEPFFTTKPPGEGTGIGLAMVAGFAQESGGALRIDSRDGHGTDVFLYLPVAEG